MGREIPELKLVMPPNALGKDYLFSKDGEIAFSAPLPSGTGWQGSLFGLLGAAFGRAEGLELNFLGLTVGFSLDPLRLVVPGAGWMPLPGNREHRLTDGPVS